LKFFEKVQDESIAKALILLLFILFIVSLIRIGLSFTIGGLFGGFMGGGMFILGGGLAYFIFGILGSFIYAGIIHVIVKIFGGEGNYVDTYNIFAYSSLPALVLSLIPFVGFLGGIFSMIIMIFGISFLHNVSKGKAVLIVLMPLILLFAFIFLMALVIISSFAGGF
jgi:hypothetical protein